MNPLFSPRHRSPLPANHSIVHGSSSPSLINPDFIHPLTQPLTTCRSRYTAKRRATIIHMCFEKYNEVAASLNSKIVAQLPVLKKQLSIRPSYLDTFQPLQDANMNPNKYGFEETLKGCCGSGITKIGETCKGQSTCNDASRYIYWDAIHPTQKMNKIIADEAVKRLANEVFG